VSLCIATAVIAYLLGSIPFGYILVRVFRGDDVRLLGSGNIGATNVARSSPALGTLTLLLDATKGLLAITAGSLLAASAAHAGARQPPNLVAAIAAVFVVVGHMFPVWLKFRGGKGVATSVGVFLALAPKTLLIALALFVAVVAAFRYVSLGSILAAAAFPLIAYALHDYRSSLAIMFAMSVIAVLVIVQHRDNIRRLLAGNEHRLALKRTRA
jgi:acyl phosphate:glycerol-3-phosphate acyltransferase